MANPKMAHNQPDRQWEGMKDRGREGRETELVTLRDQRKKNV